MEYDYNFMTEEDNEKREKELDEKTSIATPIYFHSITHDDMLNGDGLRVVLWVAGCSHHCKECQNPITWDEKGGIPFTLWEESEFWTWLKKPWTQGATFSGGDPLHPANRDKVAEMMATIKEKYPDKDIWLYSGYRLEYEETDGWYFEDANGDTFKYPALKCIDVLVDGKFECETRHADLLDKKKIKWRGSSNQRVIDVKKSLDAKKVEVHNG